MARSSRSRGSKAEEPAAAEEPEKTEEPKSNRRGGKRGRGGDDSEAATKESPAAKKSKKGKSPAKTPAKKKGAGIEAAVNAALSGKSDDLATAMGGGCIGSVEMHGALLPQVVAVGELVTKLEDAGDKSADSVRAVVLSAIKSLETAPAEAKAAEALAEADAAVAKQEAAVGKADSHEAKASELRDLAILVTEQLDAANSGPIGKGAVAAAAEAVAAAATLQTDAASAIVTAGQQKASAVEAYKAATASRNAKLTEITQAEAQSFAKQAAALEAGDATGGMKLDEDIAQHTDERTKALKASAKEMSKPLKELEESESTAETAATVKAAADAAAALANAISTSAGQIHAASVEAASAKVTAAQGAFVTAVSGVAEATTAFVGQLKAKEAGLNASKETTLSVTSLDGESNTAMESVIKTLDKELKATAARMASAFDDVESDKKGFSKFKEGASGMAPEQLAAVEAALGAVFPDGKPGAKATTPVKAASPKKAAPEETQAPAPEPMQEDVPEGDAQQAGGD
jgi:SWI/SNF-related matrix-associated actin-dependent regulator 1 of chromatin subfamily A